MTTPIREAEEEQIEIEIIHGVEGDCFAIDGYRVAGPKPWGGGTVTKSWTIPPCRLKDIKAVTKYTERAVLEGQQTSFIKALQERNPADQLVILGGLLYQYLMEETNATTANITLDNFSRHGKVLGDLEIKVTLKTQLEAKDE